MKETTWLILLLCAELFILAVFTVYTEVAGLPVWIKALGGFAIGSFIGATCVAIGLSMEL